MNASLVVPIGTLSLGCLLAFVIVGRRRAGFVDRMIDSLAWGPGLAAGILSLGKFFALSLGIGRLGVGSFLAIPLFLAVLAVWARRPSPTEASKAGSQGGFLPSWSAAVGWVVSGTLLAGYWWSFGRWLEQRPLGSYDAMGIWTYRALQWFRSGEEFPDIVGLLLESKPGYPLLVPGLIAAQFSMWGDESSGIAVATGWFFVVGLGAVTYLAVARWAASGAALAAVALLMSTPMVWRWAFAQSADLPLAYLTLASAAGLSELSFGQSRPVPPWLTGFFLGLMVWTKNEGMVLLLILVAVFAGGEWIRRGRIRAKDWAVVALGSLPGVLATAIFKQTWVSTHEIDRFLGAEVFSRLTDPARWSEVAVAYAQRLTPGSGEALWGGTWLALGSLLVIAAIRRSRVGGAKTVPLYGIAFACLFVFDVSVYLVTPEPLGWHLQTSVDRLLLQIFPVALAAVFIAFAREEAADSA